MVTPFTGVWIEMAIMWWAIRVTTRHSLHGSVDWNSELGLSSFDGAKSLPSRECGLKLCSWRTIPMRWSVTPFTGVWIEIIFNLQLYHWHEKVTPFTGVWIEIYFPPNFRRWIYWSLPSRECGLKFFHHNQPYIPALRHSLHGSVDWNDTVKLCFFLFRWSLPSRECGLKLAIKDSQGSASLGHSLHGSVDWNINKNGCLLGKEVVTPFTGVWIEIQLCPWLRRQG